jgi:hypothetical protein
MVLCPNHLKNWLWVSAKPTFQMILVCSTYISLDRLRQIETIWSHSRCVHFPLENEQSGKHMFVLTPENKRVAIGVKIDILIHFENLLHRQGMGQFAFPMKIFR